MKMYITNNIITMMKTCNLLMKNVVTKSYFDEDINI
jgi:hypothetical protein